MPKVIIPTEDNGERNGMAKKTTNDKATQKLQALVHKTDLEKPAQKDIAALRQALQQDQALWRRASDLNHMAHRQLTARFPPAIREALYLRLEAMQQDLGYAEASAIEQLLIEQVATCWLNLQVTQLVYAVATADLTNTASANHWERRLISAQRRYLKAIETLTQVRRRLRPNAVQLNIGTQQLNVVGEVSLRKRRTRSAR
ncbi:MAG TPA: hypothetical protein VFL17_23325 [Anaerolineae bacterium]|nr:hypothetical protein [Anaerolineae bacterium]